MSSRVVIAVVAAALAATACVNTGRAAEVAAGPPGSDDGRPTIALVGDSISYQSREELEARGAALGYRTEIDATSGFMTREKQEAAEAIAADPPEIAIISLGTNDAVCRLTNALIAGSCRYPDFKIADMDADLRRMAETLQGSGACVVGVNAYFGEEVGSQLEKLVGEGLLQGMVDWRTPVTEDESLRADGIGHLTVAGQRAYASTVIGEATRICGR